ncbi:MAG: YihY/virulence factor BrkB family protein [Lachnospiraceae bacterium]|nr:YihY/virulence factor BrkB family protein [Lachnospiraceae bacterium]
MRYIIFVVFWIKSFLEKMKEDCVSAYAAQASFYIMMSAFPFIMFLLTMLQYLPLTEKDLISMVTQWLPDTFSPFLVHIIQEIYTSSTTTLLSITIITTLWAASKSFYALIYGLDSVYGIPENRNYFVLRIRATIYTVVFAFLLLATLLLLAFGNSIVHAINSYFPALEDATLLVISIRASSAMCILILFFLYMYIVIPNRKSNVLAELPGAIASAAGWIGFSYLYSFYIDHMGNFSNTYGSLTAIVLLMLWIYFCMYMLLIGGEINVFIQNISNPKQE